MQGGGAWPRQAHGDGLDQTGIALGLVARACLR